MKIESSKPEGQSQVSNQDSTAAQAPTSPTDLLFSLILQAGLMPQADKPDMQTKSDTSDLSNDSRDQTQMSASTSSDNNPFLQQIKFMDASIDNMNASKQNMTMTYADSDVSTEATTNTTNTTTITATTKDVANQAQPSIQSQVQIPTAVQSTAKLPIENKQVAQQDQLIQQNKIADNATSQIPNLMPTQAKPITDADVLQVKQSMPLDTSGVDEQVAESFGQVDAKNTNPSVKNTSTVIAQPKLNTHIKSDEKIIKTKLDTNQASIHHSIFDTNSDDKNSVIEMSPTTKVDAMSSFGPVQSQNIAINTEQMSHQPVLQNKYTDALVHLGGFINSHTINMANNVDLSSASTSAPLNQALSANDLQSQYELKVDIAPRSMDSMMNEIYNAKIRIYPPELGPVMAKLKVDKNSAELSITTENEHVKAIVEQNLPQLRENFQNANITLTQIQVQTSLADARGQNSNSQHGNGSLLAQEHMHNNDDVSQAATQKSAPKASNSIVDTYA